jgi:RNA polymerase primary sigma factor
VQKRSRPDVYQKVSDETLGLYLKRISNISLLTKEQELELGRAIQRGSEKALKQLVEANLRFVVKVALRYRGCGLSLLDLINEGNVGLLEAARRYSPEHNVKFITYAVWWIRQAIIQALAAGGGAVRLPLRKARLASRSGDAAAEPVTAGTTDADVTDRRPLFFGDDVALDQRLGKELYDSRQIPQADHELIQRSFREEVERMLSVLSPREREIVELRYGLGDREVMTLEAVGKRLKLSRERVRQIEERAKQKLRLIAKSRHLKDYLN